MVIFAMATGRAIASPQAGRKVRTAQSNVPVKSRVLPQAGTDSATENYRLPSLRFWKARVKT